MRKLKANLYDYQIEAKDFALKHPRSICGMEMGLGKSLVSLATFYEKGTKGLIVCPAFLKNNWQDEIDKWTEGLDFTITSYASLRKVKEVGFDFIICDEAHKVKNPDANRTKELYKIVERDDPNYLMLLTGTPIRNRITDFWSLLNLCHGRNYDFPFYRLRYKFARTFCFERVNTFNGVTVRTYEGLRMNMVSTLKKLIAPVYHRKKLKDVALELPAQIHKDVVLKNKSKYDKEMKAAFESFEIDPKDAAFMSIKNANALAKVKSTIELAKEIIESGEKVVIFTDHKASAAEIATAFKVPAITGDMAVEQRHELVTKMQEGKSTVLVATIGALSTGVTITAANHMIFNDLPWVYSDLEQAEKRIHRIGQTLTCFYYYMFSSEIDKKIFALVMSKRKDIELLEEP